MMIYFFVTEVFFLWYVVVMNEFRVHHLVSQLLTQLRVQDSNSPEVFAELLTKNLTPYVTTQVSHFMLGIVHWHQPLGVYTSC